jgi:alcohol dehydrogenase class IV
MESSIKKSLIISNFPGPVHSLGMALAKLTGHQPGLCMGALLPAALKLRNRKKESFRSDLLLAIGGADRYADTAESDRSGKGEAALMNLISSIPGIPQGLQSLKVPRHTAEEAIAIVAKKEPALKKQDLEEIIAMAL